MIISEKQRGLIKKAIAVVLGITMTFGALMLHEKTIGNSFTAASAHTYEVDGCVYTYNIEVERDVTTLVITKAEGYGETLEIPSVIEFDGVEYPVKKIGPSFLENDTIVKKVIFPKHLKYIRYNVLTNSSVQSRKYTTLTGSLKTKAARKPSGTA
jgi:hypothetical protein